MKTLAATFAGLLGCLVLASAANAQPGGGRDQRGGWDRDRSGPPMWAQDRPAPGPKADRDMRDGDRGSCPLCGRDGMSCDKCRDGQGKGGPAVGPRGQGQQQFQWFRGRGMRDGMRQGHGMQRPRLFQWFRGLGQRDGMRHGPGGQRPGLQGFQGRGERDGMRRGFDGQRPQPFQWFGGRGQLDGMRRGQQDGMRRGPGGERDGLGRGIGRDGRAPGQPPMGMRRPGAPVAPAGRDVELKALSQRVDALADQVRKLTELLSKRAGAPEMRMPEPPKPELRRPDAPKPEGRPDGDRPGFGRMRQEGPFGGPQGDRPGPRGMMGGFGRDGDRGPRTEGGDRGPRTEGPAPVDRPVLKIQQLIMAFQAAAKDAGPEQRRDLERKLMKDIEKLTKDKD